MRWRSESRSRAPVLALVIAGAVACGACELLFAPVVAVSKFRMDVTDNIPVDNRSDLKLDLFVNFEYPDTTFSRASLNSYVDPRDRGSLRVVNRRWIDVLEEERQITVFFAEWKPVECYRGDRQCPQTVFATLGVTRALLDSLDWVLTFPP